jgi:hypothetical protein
MTKEEFWESFEHHMPALEELISGKTGDYAAYNALSDDLRAFNHFLVPEITMETEDRFILLISCDGCRLGSPAVEELTENIKAYPNWKIVKYRQPGAMEFIPLKGQKVYRKDILLTWEKMSNGQYELTFYLKWHLNNETQQTGTILHLDHTIGEYYAMTKIHDMQFKSLGIFSSKNGLKTLDDLKNEMDLE